MDLASVKKRGGRPCCPDLSVVIRARDGAIQSGGILNCRKAFVAPWPVLLHLSQVRRYSAARRILQENAASRVRSISPTAISRFRAAVTVFGLIWHSPARVFTEAPSSPLFWPLKRRMICISMQRAAGLRLRHASESIMSYLSMTKGGPDLLRPLVVCRAMVLPNPRPSRKDQATHRASLLSPRLSTAQEACIARPKPRLALAHGRMRYQSPCAAN